MTEKWNKPFDQLDKNLENILGESAKWIDIQLGVMYSFLIDLRRAVGRFRNSDFSQESHEFERKWFDEGGAWDAQFGGDFSSGPYYEETYKALKKLTDLGYDVRPQWRQFRDLTAEIWRLLPDFNKGYFLEGEIEPLPADYDPNKPFPQYPIPDDID